MCDSYFLQRMEGDQAGGGDLTDVVRAGGVVPGNAEVPSTAAEWQLQGEPMFYPPPPSSSDGCAGSTGASVFGDPFSGLGDPFSSDFSSGADFLDAMPDAMAKVGFDTAVGGGGSGCGGGGAQMLDMSRKAPLLPRGVQMPPTVGLLGPRVLPSPLSPRAIRPYPPMGGDMAKLGITAGQIAGCAIDAAVVGTQMSSPRAAGGIKRRKNQARKVVCIPAPTAASGRPTGEVLPSDLWAWRKYGQKPIKGSPYPRGYYRCSSSKGCSARKQVERCRQDPNMLVITYTSEHNHPWPTQRNALAGSTRNHHGKNGSGSSGSKSSQNEKQKLPNVKEESKDQATTASTINTATSTSPVPAVKEEALPGSEALGRTMDATGAADHNNLTLMDHVFISESYKPMIPEAGQPDDFFFDLAELESDPMSLIFSKDRIEENPAGGDDDRGKDKAIIKDLDPFEMLDWSNASSAGSSFEQGNKIG